MSREKIVGIYAAMITPFRSNGTIDTQGVKKIVDYMVEAKQDGILVAGNTGEFPLLSVDERKLLIKAACEAAAGRIKIVAGCSANWTEGTLEYVRYADSVGADYHLINPPYDMPTTEQGIIDYFEEICAVAKAGVVIHHTYEFPQAYLSPELIVRLAQIENCVGIKDVMPYEHVSQTVYATQDLENFSVICSIEQTILAGLAVGADGTMGVANMVAPRMVRELADKIAENDLNGAREIEKKLKPVYSAVLEDPFPARLKIGVELIGLPAGIPRKPMALAPEETREHLIKVFKTAGLI